MTQSKMHKNWKVTERGGCFTRYEEKIGRMVAVVFYERPGLYLVYGSGTAGGAHSKADQVISMLLSEAISIAEYYLENGKFPKPMMP